jgi:hypothetical protein
VYGVLRSQPAETAAGVVGCYVAGEDAVVDADVVSAGSPYRGRGRGSPQCLLCGLQARAVRSLRLARYARIEVGHLQPQQLRPHGQLLLLRLNDNHHPLPSEASQQRAQRLQLAAAGVVEGVGIQVVVTVGVGEGI